MKCVGCNSPATHRVKEHPMCAYHASLFPKSPKTKLRDKPAERMCKECGNELSLIPWNGDLDLYVCYQEGCIECSHPQGTEPKRLKGVMTTA